MVLCDGGMYDGTIAPTRIAPRDTGGASCTLAIVAPIMLSAAHMVYHKRPGWDEVRLSTSYFLPVCIGTSG